MKTTFYKKEGEEFVPVSEYDSDIRNAFPEGTHLIVSKSGVQLTQYSIDPNLAAMIAAGAYAKEAISRELMRASALTHGREKLTEQQATAWNALAEAFGADIYPLSYPSYQDAVQSGVDAMSREADKLMEHPSVIKSWNNFMMICKLTLESKQGQYDGRK